MAIGADRIIHYDPPGAIGLVDRAAVLHLRLNEIETIIRPQDSDRRCNDFVAGVTYAGDDYAMDMPPVVPAVLGRGRAFDGGAATGLVSSDIDPGATLLTRDVTVQVVLQWDPATQEDGIGSIIRRGLGGAAPERIAYELLLEVTDAPSRTGVLRWAWDELGGAAKLKGGAAVALPSGFTMLTATRRWISPTLVEMAYYVGDQLAGVATSTHGLIDGGTTGHLLLGLGLDTVGASTEERFSGVIDELMVYDRVLCLEEIEATWLRLTLYQPRGERLFRECFDPGFPIPDDPESEARKNQRLWGQALGFAAAQIENFRSNFLPHRAYGSTLEQWVEAVSAPTQPGLDTQTLRNRVLARLRQRRGASQDGMKDSLESILGGASVDDLEFISFSNTIRDELATLQRWQIRPTPGAWTIAGAGARSSLAAGTYPFVETMDTPSSTDWQRTRGAVQGSARGANFIVKLSLTTAPANLEAGIYFEERNSGCYLLLGIRNDGGTYRLVSESFIGGVSQGLVQHAVLGGGVDAWLWLRQEDNTGIWRGAVSFTSEISGYTETADIAHPTAAEWLGFYTRTNGAIAGAAQVDVDYALLWQPYGERPFYAYILLDEALGFHPDIQACRAVVRDVGHANTHSMFITKRNTLAGDPDSGADIGPLGEI